ncbi:MAG: site-determining protein [Armatimonadota bacterium]|nr:MAG: site-determining protein [Armatimonadota bacterium]
MAVVQDQALGLRRLISQRPADGVLGITPGLRMGTWVISVVSGTPESGKTTIATNLSALLGQTGRHVVLVDGNVGALTCNRLLGTEPRYSLEDLFADRRDLPEILVSGAAGIRVLPGGTRILALKRLPAQEQRDVIERLRSLEVLADVVLIDTGNAQSTDTFAYALSSDIVLAVALPQRESLLHTYSLVKRLLLQRTDLQVGWVMNRCISPAQAHKIGKQVEQLLSVQFGGRVQLLGSIVEDNSVNTAAEQNACFWLSCPDGLAAKGLSALAAEIRTRILSHPGAGRGLHAFLARLADYLRPPALLPIPKEEEQTWLVA